MDIYLKEGDTSPPILASLKDGDGSTVDLTGASVALSMGFNGSRISASNVIVASAVDGYIQYDWAVADTFLPGDYDAELQVTYSDGKFETFPRNDYIKVHIKRGEGSSGALLDLAIASVDARWALVNAASLQVTADRFLDISGDGQVTGEDISIMFAAKTNMRGLKTATAADVADFKAVPAAIKDMLAGTTTPVPVYQSNSQWFLTDIDGDGAITNTDLLMAEAIARYGT